MPMMTLVEMLDYKFDSAPGNVLTDSSPNANSGTIYGNSNLINSGISLDDFLTITPLAGVVGPNSAQNINLGFNAIGLVASNHSRNLTIFSDDPDEPVINLKVIFNVNGQPIIVTSADTLVFPNTFLGYPNTLPLTVYNTGSATMNTTGWNLSSSEFSISTTPALISPFSSATVDVTFDPLTVGSKLSSLTIISDAINENSLEVYLKGDALPPPVWLATPAIVDFGAVIVGFAADSNIALSNTGESPLEVYGVMLSNTNSFSHNLSTPFTIDTGQTVVMNLDFHPNAYQNYFENVEFNTNIGTHEVVLTGSGVTAGHDLGVIATLEPATGCGLGEFEPVRIVIRNNGSLPQTGFDVAFSLNGNPPIVENVGGLTVPPGAAVDFTFSATVNLTAYSTYQFEAFTLLTGDQDSSNDTLSGVSF